jgi:HAD superfamily hydrolase (TIGR01549 family)
MNVSADLMQQQGLFILPFCIIHYYLNKVLKNRGRPDKFAVMRKKWFKGTEAILFDFGGTLVDFQWNRARAVQETLEMLSKLGFPTDRLKNERYSTLMAEAMRMASKIGRSSDEVREKIGDIYDRFDEDALTRWTLRPQVKDLLSLLKTKGIKTGLVTNIGKRALEKAFQKMELDQLFNVTVSRNDVLNLKPSGEGLNLALNQLQVTKDKALYVGDTLDDISAAKEVGLEVIIVLGGENSNRELLSAGPDGIIRNLGELLTCF